MGVLLFLRYLFRRRFSNHVGAPRGRAPTPLSAPSASPRPCFLNKAGHRNSRRGLHQRTRERANGNSASHRRSWAPRARNPP